MSGNRLSPGFRVQVGKPRNTPCSCFLHTALCCSALTTGHFRAARSTLLALLTSPQSARSARNVCSLIFLYDSTYVRVCQAVWEIICGLHSFGVRNCAGCKKVLCFLGGFPIAPEPLRTATLINSANFRSPQSVRLRTVCPIRTATFFTMY